LHQSTKQGRYRHLKFPQATYMHESPYMPTQKK